jgi:RNA polymerase sigma-70 factor (ECF subfamily)
MGSHDPPQAISVAPTSAVPLPLERQALFRKLFESNFTYVWNALRRLGIRHADREDLANEVFVRVYRALDAFDPSRPARPWLFAFAFRVASDHRKLARHRLEVALEPVEGRLAAPGDESLERAEQRALVQAALEHVDLEKRAVLILHDLEEEPIPEVARTLSIPEGTAYSRLRAAREQFTAAIRREQMPKRPR